MPLLGTRVVPAEGAGPKVIVASLEEEARRIDEDLERGRAGLQRREADLADLGRRQVQARQDEEEAKEAGASAAAEVQTLLAVLGEGIAAREAAKSELAAAREAAAADSSTAVALSAAAQRLHTAAAALRAAAAGSASSAQSRTGAQGHAADPRLPAAAAAAAAAREDRGTTAHEVAGDARAMQERASAEVADRLRSLLNDLAEMSLDECTFEAQTLAVGLQHKMLAVDHAALQARRSALEQRRQEAREKNEELRRYLRNAMGRNSQAELHRDALQQRDQDLVKEIESKGVSAQALGILYHAEASSVVPVLACARQCKDKADSTHLRQREEFAAALQVKHVRADATLEEGPLPGEPGWNYEPQPLTRDAPIFPHGLLPPMRSLERQLQEIVHEAGRSCYGTLGPGRVVVGRPV